MEHLFRIRELKFYEERFSSVPILKLDKNLLYLAYYNKIITWNLDTRDEVHRFDMNFSIFHFVVKSPYVLIVSDDEDSCLNVYHLVEESVSPLLVLEMDFNVNLFDIGIFGNVFFILFTDHDNSYKLSFFLFDELMDYDIDELTDHRRRDIQMIFFLMIV